MARISIPSVKCGPHFPPLPLAVKTESTDADASLLPGTVRRWIALSSLGGNPSTISVTPYGSWKVTGMAPMPIPEFPEGWCLRRVQWIASHGVFHIVVDYRGLILSAVFNGSWGMWNLLTGPSLVFKTTGRKIVGASVFGFSTLVEYDAESGVLISTGQGRVERFPVREWIRAGTKIRNVLNLEFHLMRKEVSSPRLSHMPPALRRWSQDVEGKGGTLDDLDDLRASIPSAFPSFPVGWSLVGIGWNRRVLRFVALDEASGPEIAFAGPLYFSSWRRWWPFWIQPRGTPGVSIKMRGGRIAKATAFQTPTRNWPTLVKAGSLHFSGEHEGLVYPLRRWLEAARLMARALGRHRALPERRG